MYPPEIVLLLQMPAVIIDSQFLHQTFAEMHCALFPTWPHTCVQLIQEGLAETERGAFCGLQEGVQAFLLLLSYIAALCLNKPEQFGILVAGSLAAVVTSALLFTYQVHYKRHSLSASPTASLISPQQYLQAPLSPFADQIGVSLLPVQIGKVDSSAQQYTLLNTSDHAQATLRAAGNVRQPDCRSPLKQHQYGSPQRSSGVAINIKMTV